MNKTDKKTVPYGLWPNPITAALISQRIRLDDVMFSGDGNTIVWVEGRSAASVMVAQTGTSARQDLTDEQSPRGGVGYGGGIFSITGDTVFFANRDGKLYRRSLGYERPQPITPAFGPSPSGAVASPAGSPDGKWVVYIYSDGKTDLLALVDAHGSTWPVQLSQGADFYMQPAWHPAGQYLAWVEWDHPNMPWDGTRIQLARVEGSPPRLVDVKTVGGGSQSPSQQPIFSPDGRWLCFIEEAEGAEWPTLALYDLQSGQRRALVAGAGFDMAQPAWAQGVRSIGWRPDSQGVYYLRYQGINASLWYVDLNSGQSIQLDTQPYTWLGQLSVNPVKEELVFFASGPQNPTQVVRWSKNGLQVVAHSLAATYSPAYLPTSREITWDTSDNSQAHGIYYPPSSPGFHGTGLPPAIVHIHGGPTSLAGNGFNADAAYYTSRGFAYVEVNYRGSTGYGRAYRHAMRQRWGDVDVEDAASCARFLAAQGLADPGKLVITGGSAGGYTVLNTLIRYPGLYKAGVCLYGVTNLFMLDMDTHKFEERYNASMIGPLPEAAQRYHDWSPVFHANHIQDALYIFQGNEDKVVPPSQAEEIVKTLKANGIPYQYKVYEGEGHGFRKSETITDYLKETERFLRQYVLFAA